MCVDNKVRETIGDVYCPTCRSEKCVYISTKKITSCYDCKKCKACCHVLNHPFKDQKPAIILFSGDGTQFFPRKTSCDYEKRKAISTDDQLCYSTSTGSIHSKFFIPDRVKQSKLLDDPHTKSLYSPSVPIIFSQIQKSFPSVLPKRVYPVSRQTHNKSAQRKLAKHKKTSPGKISMQSSTIVSKTYNLEAK